MYINKIDDLIDKVIDDFFTNIKMNDKMLDKINKEINFVKFQKEINSIMSEFSNSIDLTEMRELVKSSDAMYTISETIKRYIAFYLFLTIGFNYGGKEDTFINNIVEFTKNQSEYGYKINNFFNSESNATLIKYNTMVKNILILLNADQSKIDVLKTKTDFKETILFLNQLGFEYIDKNFNLENLKNDKKTQAHNIIKTIIVLLLYRTTEKKEFFRLLEMTENLEGDYMFIDVVVPKKQYIDFSAVERLVGSDTIVKNLAYYFWQFLTEHEEFLQKPPLNIEEKIILLIESGLLYPICDDFLTYHKDTEKYDRTVEHDTLKKKEDTKLRYIINKIESTSDYYSEQIKNDEKIRNNIRRNFYIPLLNRKAIIVNNNENIHIVNKFMNQSKKSIENEEYLNDLKNYMSYPYINFKDFEKAGFSITLSKTIDVIRYVSVLKDGDFKQQNKYNLQMRVCSKDMTINVVGFMIPTNLRPIECLKSKDIVDVRELSETSKNAYDLIFKYLQQSTLNTKKHSSSIYWIFDLDKDIVTTEVNEFEQVTKTSLSDQIKHIISSLYDNVINELYYVILDKLEKQKELTIQSAYRMINLFDKKILHMPSDSDIISKLEEKIYLLIKKSDASYDKNDDMIHGISGDIVQLPTYENLQNQTIQTVKINLSDIGEYGEIETKDSVEGICQHNITWENITSLQKSNPKLYTDQLYNFIQQYVLENVDQDFICKSCGFQLNIRKYIIDGVFDDDTQRFVTFSMPMDIPLEDILEYEKYKITIRNIDKLIEKLASVSNLPHLTKSSFHAKSQRKAIVKDTIDLVIMNNKKLKVNLKERNEIFTAKYGIDRDKSNLFVFELENAIFVFSSKDKDHYKPIKQNNILTYIIFLLLLDINDSHILFMGSDKKGTCNIQIFDKIFHSLFDGLKIRINNKGDIVNITNYKLLCYMIYIIGCMAVKYNMWYYEYPDITKKKQMSPILIKAFVHTIVDIMNSVLEYASIVGSHYLYEIISIKMFKKLKTSFGNDELYERLKSNAISSAVGERKDFSIAKKKFTSLTGKFEYLQYEQPIRVVCRVPTYRMSKKIKSFAKYYDINNITNCPSGQFHEWKPKSENFVCNICGTIASDVTINDKESDKILDNFKFVRLREIAKKICISDGTLHQFALNPNGEYECIKCHKSNKYNYSDKELDTLEYVFEKERENNSNKLIEKETFINNEMSKDITYINDITNSLEKSYYDNTKKNQYEFINKFIDILYTIIGNELNSDTHLKDNIYIIDHDQYGGNINNKIIITDKDNKIFYKQNHPFFKTDVIYYSSHKTGKVDIFYDAISNILLGYKEESKNFILNKKQDKHIIINYSIANKLKIIGYTSKFIDISVRYAEMNSGREHIQKLNKTIISNKLVADILRCRLDNMKKIIYEFQRILSRIINNYGANITDDRHDFFSNKINSFVEKYRKNLSNMTIRNKTGVIFENWRGIVKGIYISESIDISLNFDEQKVINTEELNKLDKGGNLILFYIIEEFTKLISYNTDKLMKLTVINFAVDFINLAFGLFNMEKLENNIEIKKFEYMLASDTYIREIIENSEVREVEGIYSEYIDDEQQEMLQDEKDRLDDEAEENDAIDMDTEFQYEGQYDRSQDFEPSNQIVFSAE